MQCQSCQCPIEPNAESCPRCGAIVHDSASPIFGLSAPTPGGGAAGRPIIGESPVMQRVVRNARLASASASTVLITGENGTGKELLARAIHHYSSRSERPFAPINCAAIPEGLLESELFGHEKGAFTGATQQKIGLIEAAEGGTLFLDEVGDLSLGMQVKFLRFLQEREINRVGGATTFHVDVRIIAATNRNLEHLVETGLFRNDLYFRLNVVPIHIPPLRERAQDIPLLVRHFIEKYAKDSAFKRGTAVNYEDMKILSAYEWPGNVRELENIIERAIVMGTQVGHIMQGIASQRQQLHRPASIPRPSAVPPRLTVLQTEDHPPPPRTTSARAEAERERLERMHESREIREEELAARVPAFRFEEMVPTPEELWEPLPLAEIERLHIERTLDYTGGNRAKAAKLLGINPATLWRKIKGYAKGPDSPKDGPE